MNCLADSRKCDKAERKWSVKQAVGQFGETSTRAGRSNKRFNHTGSDHQICPHLLVHEFFDSGLSVYPCKKQKILQSKTVKVDEEIVELTKQLELVEKDHQIQLEANNTQLERLGL